MVHQIQFYDLELLDKKGLTFSPNTNKIRLALNVKGLPYETKWVDFGSIKTIVPEVTKLEKRPTVPVIVDSIHGSNKTIHDSWDIALYLEEQYSDHPSLFHGNTGVHRFFQHYADKHLIFPLFKLVMLLIYKQCGPAELQVWYRQDREKLLGCTLEEFVGEKSDNMASIKKALLPVIDILAEFPFLTGDKVGWADIVLASQFITVNVLDPETFETAVLTAFDSKENNLIQAWWKRMETYL